MKYVTTVAISDRGNYHIALNDPNDLRPLCGAKPEQRATGMPVEQFQITSAAWYCSRCTHLRLTEGRWDGR